MDELEKLFNDCEDDYMEFEKIESPKHPRPDLCALLMLDELLPGPGRDMVSAAEHDQFWLDVDEEKLAEVATLAIVRDLRRCGVMYEPGMGLSFFA